MKVGVAIVDVTAGLNTVTFDLTGATGAYGEYTITLTSTLPTISDAIYLNGASQSGYTTRPLIVLDGEGGSGNGLAVIRSS